MLVTKMLVTKIDLKSNYDGNKLNMLLADLTTVTNVTNTTVVMIN